MVFTLARQNQGTPASGQAGNSVSIRKAGVHQRPWGVRVKKNPGTGTTLPIDSYRSKIFDHALDDSSWQMPNVAGLEQQLEAAKKAAKHYRHKGGRGTAEPAG